MVRTRYITIIALLLGLTQLSLAQGNDGPGGYLKLTTPAQVGDFSLPPGEYEVTLRVLPTGHFMEFTRVTQNGFGYLGAPINQKREVLAAVNCTIKPITGTNHETTIKTENSRIVSLAIKGENVICVF